MKIFSLGFQYIISYLILTIAILLLLNTYGYSVIYGHLLSNQETVLYEEAETLAKQVLPQVGNLNDSGRILQNQLEALQTLNHIRIWLVDENGQILMDNDSQNTKAGENIRDYDKKFLANRSISGKHPEKLIEKPMLSVIYPLTGSYKITGYFVLMYPINSLETQTEEVLDTIIICYIIVFCLTGLIFVYLHHQTVRPLKKMTIAAKEYADGHFDYPMVKMNGQDQADLATAIQYLAEKMSSMNEYQKRFLANVSHDFRSPLTSIKGYTEAIADGTIPPEMQEKYFNIILFEVERLRKLTSNLLDLNQFESNGMIIEITSFDINQAIKETVETFEPQCEKKQISINLIFESTKLIVDADLPKIQRVIQNLIDNAIKFSKQESEIEVHTTEQQHKCFISVKDHGMGIPKEDLSKIWIRFYKGDTSRGKDKTGTGLGLSITKEIIEAHGENINVISTEGVGTEFIFSLPVTQEEKK